MAWLERILGALRSSDPPATTTQTPQPRTASSAPTRIPTATPPTPATFTPSYPVADDDDEPQPKWYVPADGDKSRFTAPVGGMPPLHLIPYQDGLRLCEDSTGLLVSPNDRRLPGVGIFVVNVRGETYYKAACKAGDFSPGVSVRLRREPDNPYDANAVAITADADGAPVIGYVNKQKARIMSRIIDGGAVLEAISLRGNRAGVVTDQVAILAAEPELIDHLRSTRPATFPRPAFMGPR
ncbi:hypothetical protein GCM10022399_19990 [Terrabacter ginsenosidimutans]|uniref:HIRAN domain-containing protein n=1 Tax=Terrabacter ginsenosidimutans TaxID=490575 RepID=A0ABP7DBW1_9MICO